jgi:uncharacterized protein YbjT (DUF2867 family)
MTESRPTVLLTGATGFVGRHVHEPLSRVARVVRASRTPERAARRFGDGGWRRLDVTRSETIASALEGCNAALYLIHEMSDDPAYAERESRHAAAFARAARDAGVRRIVYLGGMRPVGRPSRHLRSRLEVGEVLRSSGVSTVELRASMIIGAGSQSWQIVRDLARRLPAMVLPRWLESRTQPIWIGDVAFALVRALQLPDDLDGVWDIPGPETLTGREILMRVARLCGTTPIVFEVPFVSPRLSSVWLRLVTSADFHVARELVEGLRTDVVSSERSLWRIADDHACLPFDEAARRTLATEARPRAAARVVEQLAHGLSRRAATGRGA